MVSQTSQPLLPGIRACGWWSSARHPAPSRCILLLFLPLPWPRLPRVLSVWYLYSSPEANTRTRCGLSRVSIYRYLQEISFVQGKELLIRIRLSNQHDELTSVYVFVKKICSSRLVSSSFEFIPLNLNTAHRASIWREHLVSSATAKQRVSHISLESKDISVTRYAFAR